MNRSYMASVPGGVTEVEYKRSLARLEQDSARRGGSEARAESKAMVDAAALQLDMSRRFNLGGTRGNRGSGSGGADTGGAKRSAKQIGNGYETKSSNRSSSSFASTLAPAGPWASDRSAAPKNPSDHVYCMSCHAANLSTESVCTMCGFFLEGPMRPAPLTLAQRRGLAQPPSKMDAPVLRSEWEIIEAKLVDRHDATCPICMEGFNQGYEVVLSCSHIFHRSCLESFESFMGRDTRSCPICRKSNYQKKITKCGTAAWEIHCATKVQSVYRGYLQRQHFYNLYFRDSGSSSSSDRADGKGARLLRHRYLSQELTALTHARKKEVDRVMSGIDATLNENQELDLLFDQMLRSRQTYHGVTGTSELSEALEEDQRMVGSDGRDNRADSNDGHNDDGDIDGAEDDTHEKIVLSEEHWREVASAARKRGLGQCSICLGDNKGLRGLSLLSCSHIFHSNCLLSFKRFAMDRKVGGWVLVIPCYGYSNAQKLSNTTVDSLSLLINYFNFVGLSSFRFRVHIPISPLLLLFLFMPIIATVRMPHVQVCVLRPHYQHQLRVPWDCFVVIVGIGILCPCSFVWLCVFVEKR